MSVAASVLAMSLLTGAFDKAYVKGNFYGQKGMKELTFGLTLEQKEKIASLTEGKIDFRNHFVTTSIYNKAVFDLNAEFHSSKHLPPVIVSEYDPQIKTGWWQQAHKVNEAWKTATGKGVTIAD